MTQKNIVFIFLYSFYIYLDVLDQKADFLE